MRISKEALFSVVLCGSAISRVSDAFTITQAPPGLLGKQSLLDMVGSYLDNLNKPTYSSYGESEKKGPKQSYMYTFKSGESGNKKSGARSGGSYLENLAEPSSQSSIPNTSAYLGDLKEPIAKPTVDSMVVGSMMNSVSDASNAPRAPVTSVNYLDNLSQQPTSFKKANFMYKGVPSWVSQSSGVSPGNYLDNLPSKSATSTPNYESVAPPTPPVAQTTVTSQPFTPPPQTAGVSSTDKTASSGNYLDAISGGSAPMRSNGYTYKPKRTGHKAGPSNYLDNIGNVSPQAIVSKPPTHEIVPETPSPASSNKPLDAVQSQQFSSAAPAPRGNYIESLGASAAPRKQGGYVYKPSKQASNMPGSYSPASQKPPSTRSPQTINDVFSQPSTAAPASGSRDYLSSISGGANASSKASENVYKSPNGAEKTSTQRVAEEVDVKNYSQAVNKHRISELEAALTCAKKIKAQVEGHLAASAHVVTTKSGKLVKVAEELNVSIEKLMDMKDYTVKSTGDSKLDSLEYQLAREVRNLDKLACELLRLKNEIASDLIKGVAEGPRRAPADLKDARSVSGSSLFEKLRSAFKEKPGRSSDSGRQGFF